MLREWEKKHPGRIETIFNALGNVVPTHLLDRTLRDFAAVRAGPAPVPDGDIAFDDDAGCGACGDAKAVGRIRCRGALRSPLLALCLLAPACGGRSARRQPWRARRCLRPCARVG